MTYMQATYQRITYIQRTSMTLCNFNKIRTCNDEVINPKSMQYALKLWIGAEV